jgi:hypothetical protein
MMNMRQLPAPVFALVAALYNDQRAAPHRLPTDYPLSTVMAAAHRFDKSGRTRSEYELLSAFIERWARKKMRPDAVCDECSRLMSREYAADDFADLDYLHVFSLGRTLNSYFLCSQCAATWRAEGDSGLPRITGLKHYYKHEERWAEDGKAKLPALPPSGGLFAGLVIPGGSEPITVPLRMGDGALSNVSRILNSVRFDLTEAAA